ncbi:DNA repair protein RecO [Swingsia samuiensis]|uniref:DNA repair protein RecO n=1 Tax=Swingsia samuiensis TaxID=1293412 RepID=A0A4Y6UJL3_9PROT|nr:DNA repair protein RecO [Swingsia samuiensis]QDH16195.1 DNA repair protein RecO [Swingsia samuiensis]
MVEWEEAALIVSVQPYGEGSALVHLFSEQHGISHGMVRGGRSRRQSFLWQVGNLVMARYRARLAENLGSIIAEPIQSVGNRLLDFPLSLAIVTSACALVDGALPQGEAHPELFMRLVRLLMLISLEPHMPSVTPYLLWEKELLAELGYGLDLSVCAVTGHRENLKFVSPKTGRAVSEEGAGEWRDRLLPLPSFFLNTAEDGSPEEWLQGMNLTGHFFSRWVFGVRHLPLPFARERLLNRVHGLVENGPDVSV